MKTPKVKKGNFPKSFQINNVAQGKIDIEIMENGLRVWFNNEILIEASTIAKDNLFEVFNARTHNSAVQMEASVKEPRQMLSIGNELQKLILSPSELKKVIGVHKSNC
jgi:hypothetical protein